MKIIKFNFLMIVAGTLIFGGCQEDIIDDGSPENTGKFKIEMTDAPIDDTSVEGVFVTVTALKVDGVEIENFNKTTLDIKALQNGKTKEIFNQNFSTGNYNTISLEFDYDEDQNGNSPGCYVMKTDGSKDPISSDETEITLDQDFEIKENGETNLIIDFDLRKTIKEENSDFELVSGNSLELGFRSVEKSNSGTIIGNCNDLLAGADAVIVYAYKKDTYNRTTEIQGNQTTNLEFSNAITSAMVDANGNYELHYLDPGSYEIHYGAYERMTNGSLRLSGTLILQLLEGLDLTNVQVEASSTLTLDVVATGILP